MKNKLVKKLAVPAVVVALGVLGATPLAAQTTVPPPEEVATLTVTKTVVGTAPTDAEFTLHLSCSAIEDEDDEVATQVTDYDEDIVFGSTGGSEEFEFTGPSACEITETDDGGALSNSGSVEVLIEDPIAYEAEITNTFAAAETTTTAPAAAAAAVETTATFTG